MKAKIDRLKMYITWFYFWSESTYIPINYVLLGSSTFAVGVCAVTDNYNYFFWVAVLGGLWAVYDIIKWRRRNRTQSRASS